MLIILKNDRFRDKERKREIESLIGGVDDERFNLLVNLGKKITDWSNSELGNQARNGQGNLEDEEIDENVGVKVMIEDDEEDAEEENGLYEINDEENDEDEEEDVNKHQITSGKVKKIFVLDLIGTFEPLFKAHF